MGIGKDTLLEPIRYAVGDGNFKEAGPRDILGRWNYWLKSVVLRINEAHDLGEFDRFKFYDHMKNYIAAPPETLMVDEKYLRQYYILNRCGVVITTNYKMDGIYLPADDRRHYVAWSERAREEQRFAGSYWSDLYDWYGEGGNENVAAFLMQRDISRFDAKAPPPKTEAFWAIADANRAPEEAELADLLDKLDHPNAISLRMLQGVADDIGNGFADWVQDARNRRAIPHRMERCGYAPVRNPDATDGLWKLFGKRQAVYAKRSLPPREQITAARALGQPSQHSQ
jgi:hypothetical protein